MVSVVHSLCKVCPDTVEDYVYSRDISTVTPPPRGRARSSHWAIFLLNNIAITNNSTFPKMKLHYSISYCNKP